MTLNEQKKVLVKEVKQCRKRNDAVADTLASLTVEKDQLSTHVQEVENRCDLLVSSAKDQDFAHAQSIIALQDMYEGESGRFRLSFLRSYIFARFFKLLYPSAPCVNFHS